MAGAGAERIVADPRRGGATCPGGVLQQRMEGPRWLDVEVEVDAPVVREDEVAEGVDALDGVGVGGVDGEEPGVFSRDELECAFVCPELLRSLGR